MMYANYYLDQNEHPYIGFITLTYNKLQCCYDDGNHYNNLMMR